MVKRWGWILGVILCGASWSHAQAPGNAPKAGEGPETIPAPRQPVAVAPMTTVAPAPVSLAEAPPSDSITVFGGADYLLWWVRRNNSPPLVSTGNELASATAGVLGDPTTTVLFAPAGIDFPNVSGVRMRAGAYLDPENLYSIRGEGFLLEIARTELHLASTAPGQPFIARPFFDTFNNRESAYVDSSRVGFTGRNDIVASSRFYGWDTNVGFHPTKTMSVYAGFRTLSLYDHVRYDEAFRSLTQGSANGSLFYLGKAIGRTQSLATTDDFGTTNRFYGPQIGGEYRWEFGPLSFELLGKIAAGWTFQKSGIAGATYLLNSNGTIASSTPAGVLALPSNSGNNSRNEFTLAPSLDLTMCFDLASWCRLRLGYSVIYMSSVLRAGNQIDHYLDPRTVPTDPLYNPTIVGANPAFLFNDKDFYAHGVNFGVDIRY